MSGSELVIRPDEATLFALGGIGARILVSAAQTGGGLAIVDAPIAPRTLAGPLHTHRHEDALWYVVDGEFGAQVGDLQVREGPGTVVLAPRGVPHTYWNPGSTPARYLEIAWPAGLERYLEQLGTLTADAAGAADSGLLEAVDGLSHEFGIEMDWASLGPLMDKHGVGFAG